MAQVNSLRIAYKYIIIWTRKKGEKKLYCVSSSLLRVEKTNDSLKKIKELITQITSKNNYKKIN